MNWPRSRQNSGPVIRRGDSSTGPLRRILGKRGDGLRGRSMEQIIQDAGEMEAQFGRENALPHPRWVRQVDAGGCALATFAMIAGITYGEAKRIAADDPTTERARDWSDGGGTSHITLDWLLGLAGFYGRSEYVAWHKTRMVPEDGRSGYYVAKQGHVWPPKPFAPIHYAQVEQPSRNSHFVVVLADGGVLDPLREGCFALTDWPEVNHVVGLVKGEAHA